MLRAAVQILPVDVFAMAGRCSCGCCSLLCGLCCCCCGNRAKKETSPILSSQPVREPTAVMSRVQVTPCDDGQSETQRLELTVHPHDDDEEEIIVSSVTKDTRPPREPPSRDLATSTTFVRGSSGRSSWRMVPHPKRQSQISVKSDTSTSAPAQETEASEVTVEMVAVATETPPPPPKDYRLTQSFEDDQSEPSQEGEGIVHTSSFSFTARDGRLVDTH